MLLQDTDNHRRARSGYPCIMCRLWWAVTSVTSNLFATLAHELGVGELTRLGSLSRSCRRLHDAAWRAIWCARSKSCGGAELERILRLAITQGKAANVRELVRPMAEQGEE